MIKYINNTIRKASYTIAAAIAVCIVVSCESLDVENTNDPNVADLIENNRDFGIFAQNIYHTYWQGIRGVLNSSSPQMASMAAADQITASWYTLGCYDMSMEPRIAWNNTPNYEYKELTYSFYGNMYVVITNANTTIKYLKGGKKIKSDNTINYGYLSYAYMMQGIALGQLALTFDSAQVVKETTDLNKLYFQPYNEIMDSAIASLENAIAISDTVTFSLGNNIVNGVSLTSNLINRLCHSYIARFLTLNARNKSEYAATDWAKVLANAKKGLNVDFGPQGDGHNNWSDEVALFLTNLDNTIYFFCKADNRIINLLDPSYPSRYWKNGHAKVVHAGYQAGEAVSTDKRLSADFEFSSGIKFYQDRGTVHYSNYRYKRYDYLRKSGLGQMIDFAKYENSLYAIEAWINMGELTLAINSLNTHTLARYDRGRLPAIDNTATKKELLDIVFYERDIELFGQGYLISFCDMRRRDKLQKGTPLHFPVPANELQTLQHKLYTYGGVENADGTNTSNGGW